MFTPSMTNAEIEAVAYKDFLEIRGRVQIAMDKFVKRVRCTGPGQWCLHSLQETHTIQTRSKNTWTVYFHYLHTTPTGIVRVSSMVYILLPRNKGTDYLFILNLDRFRLERLSSHFLRRYKERYIDLNQIQLNGLHPAIYFMRTNGDRRPATGFLHSQYLDRGGTEGQISPRLGPRTDGGYDGRTDRDPYHFHGPEAPERLPGDGTRGGDAVPEIRGRGQNEA